jgi:hypothetical protein
MKEEDKINSGVTKVILKDLKKGGYREINKKSNYTEPVRESKGKPWWKENISVILVTTFLLMSGSFVAIIFSIYLEDKKQKEFERQIIEASLKQQDQYIQVINEEARRANQQINNFQRQIAQKPQPGPRIQQKAQQPAKPVKPSKPEKPEIYSWVENGVPHFSDRPPSQTKASRTPRQSLENIEYTVYLKNGAKIQTKAIYQIRQGYYTMFDGNMEIEKPKEELLPEVKKVSKVNGRQRISIVALDSF